MDKKQVQHIIHTMAQVDLLNFLLDRANLSQKERKVIDLRVRQDRTQEDSAEQVERSVSFIKKYEERAYKKLIENWQGIFFLEKF